MNAETMTINPNELVIDLPVDDAHVQELMTSLQKNGRMVEPVTVWLQGMRIINGFHRTEAAKRLGWESMPCLIQDLTEDEFWDARIIAAKPHQAISNDRLAVWILESWKQTPWYVEEDKHTIVRDYAKYGLTVDERTLAPDVLQRYHAAKTVWNLSFSDTEKTGEKRQVERDKGHGKRKQHYSYEIDVTRPRNLTPQEQWFIGKGEKWGISRQNIRAAMLTALGYSYAPSNGGRMDYFENLHLKEWNLTFAERNAILQQAKIDIAVDREASFDVDGWVKRVQSGESLSFVEYKQVRKIEQERQEQEEQARIRAEVQAQSERRKAFLQTAAGRAQEEKEIQQEKRNSINHALQFARYQLQDTARYLNALPDAPALIAEFAQFVADFSAEHFPDVQVAKPNSVALENSRLQAENAKLKERIASLERALGSKQAAGEMLSSAMAWSSGDMER